MTAPTLREGEPGDAERCGAICYAAFYVSDDRPEESVNAVSPVSA